MCGRFAQVQTRADYLDVLASGLEVASGQDNVPIGRYNVAPGTRVILLNQRDGKIYMDPVNWGYRPDWWIEMKRQPVINAGSKQQQPAVCSSRCGTMAEHW